MKLNVKFNNEDEKILYSRNEFIEEYRNKKDSIKSINVSIDGSRNLSLLSIYHFILTEEIVK